MGEQNNQRPILLRGRLNIPDVIQATDGLIEALALLPSKTHAHVFSAISACQRDFWMQFEYLTQADLGVFVERCQTEGIALTEVCSWEGDELAGRADHWHSLGSRSSDQCASILALTVAQTHEMTLPGKMREVTRALHQRGFCGFAVLDFKMAARTGLASFGLTLMLQTGEHHVTADAASEAAALVSTCLNVVSRLHDGQTAQRIMTRVEPRNRDWRRPRLPATLGNIADFFPL